GLRKAKIRNVDLVGDIDQDVLRLQVSMDDVLGVSGREGSGKLLREFQHALERKLSIVPYDLVKILAFDIGHGNELHAGKFAHVVNAKYVFVRDLAGENQLLLEAA